MLADTAKLIVDLSLQGNFVTSMTKATKSLNTFDTKLSQTESRAYRAGQQIGTGIKRGAAVAAAGVGLLVSQITVGLQSLIKLENAQTQTNAVIKSTGAVAGVSAEMVRKLAEQYESLNATVGDETIQNAENLLLTFTNIRKDAFEPTLKAALDMNAALGGGPEGLANTVQLLGRALDNPEKGLALLERRVGKFTDEEKKQIKEAVKANDLLKAQSVILEKLNLKYKDSFISGGTTTAAKVAKFGDAIEDLQRTLASGFLPVINNVADALSKTLADPKVIASVETFGKELAALISPENIATAGAILEQVFNTAKDAAPAIAASAQIMAKVISTAVGVFKSLPPEIQQLAIGAFAINKLTGGLVTNIAGGLISSVLKQLVSGVVNVTGASVIVTGPGMMGDVAPGAAAKGGLGLASKVFLVGEAIGLAALVLSVKNGISDSNTQFASALSEQNAKWLAQNPTKAELLNGLKAVEDGMLEIIRTDPQNLVSGQSLQELKNIRLAILAQIAATNALPGKMRFAINNTTTVNPSTGFVVPKKTKISPQTGFAIPRAGGGPTEKGEEYLVGERGPELFVPNIGGRILPHGQTKMQAAMDRLRRMSARQRSHQLHLDLKRFTNDLGLVEAPRLTKSDPRFVPSVRLDPSQIQDRRPLVVKVTSSIKDTNTAQDIRSRWGKTPTQVGAA